MGPFTFEEWQEILKEIPKAEKYLMQLAYPRGPYGHNIASSVLRIFAEKFGIGMANKLVAYYKLEKKLGIRPVHKEDINTPMIKLAERFRK